VVPEVRILYPGEVFGAVRTTFIVCVRVFAVVTEAWLMLDLGTLRRLIIQQS
jgi:hypothetical protein